MKGSMRKKKTEDQLAEAKRIQDMKDESEKELS